MIPNTDLFEWDNPVPVDSIWLNSAADVIKTRNDLKWQLQTTNLF